MRWRRALVDRLNPHPGPLLDVCTGTAGVAIEIARRGHPRVVGLDLSGAMLAGGQRRLARNGLARRVALVEGTAQRLPFAAGSFDAVAFTFLLRYVEDAPTTLRELARVLRPGGQLLSLEFGVPGGPLFRPLWLLYTRAALPALTLPLSPGWRRAGRFLGPSISALERRYPLERQRDLWRDAGLRDVRVHRLSLGGAVVMEGVKAL